MLLCAKKNYRYVSKLKVGLLNTIELWDRGCDHDFYSLQVTVINPEV